MNAAMILGITPILYAMSNTIVMTDHQNVRLILTFTLFANNACPLPRRQALLIDEQ